jgi:glycosyltransferase involved in cell wall biosynthesis
MPTRHALRFHVLAIQHTVSSKEYGACAFTQKVVKFCDMMTKLGHTVIHYGNELSDVVCTEHVTVLSAQTHGRVYDRDWRSTRFQYSLEDDAYKEFNDRAIAEIGKRKQPNDFLLAFWGIGHKSICDAHPDMIAVEPGIGYNPDLSFCRWRVYESYAQLHSSRGTDAATERMNWYHAVVPNYFDADDFTYDPSSKEEYYLYLGRIVGDKGVLTAIEVTQAIGAKLVIAGQGGPEAIGLAGSEWPSHVTFSGYADSDARRRLMSRARASFVLSEYLEPFGGVAVENMLSGTPVISTDWGAFTEHNVHGVTGFRCRTFAQMVWAAQNVGMIDPQKCRDQGMRYTMARIGPMYEEYFCNVMDVHVGDGFYERYERAAIWPMP